MSYPRRPPHFAHKFCRLLTKSAAALQIGPEACWLLTLVVHQEDAKRYRGPVGYWNHKLMDIVGVSSIGRLTRIRQAAVDGGWLHYQAGGKGRAGLYWVLIPKHAEGVEDGECNDSDDTFPVHIQSQNATTNGHGTATANGRETEDKRDDVRLQTELKRSPFIPSPIPSPNSHTDGVAFEVSPGVEIDWLIAESAFMARWNATDGVTHYSRTSIPNELVRTFQDRYLDPGWLDRAEQALKKFPLPSGNVMTLGTFLKDGKVDEILGGSNDWSRNGKRTNTTQRNPSLRHADDAESDWLVADDSGDAAEAG